jgi:tRNA pseudouridine38-40 synthase
LTSRRYRGILAYDGTRYQGFQRQAAGKLTIQGELEHAIEKVTAQGVIIMGAGRTDAGVHATGQVVAFDCAWRHSSDELLRAINANLPPDIALKFLSEAAAGFHPRYDAISRRYVYHFYAAAVREPLWDRVKWCVGPEVDLNAMQAAADVLTGSHDFATFGQPTQGTVTIRHLHAAQFQAEADGAYRFTIEANAFLKHMVRSIMGSLVQVGRGLWTVEQFAEAFRAADRSKAAATAPPHGLVLVSVRYDEGE